MEGHASISPDVLARYAADAALEVDGVHGSSRATCPATGRSGSRSGRTAACRSSCTSRSSGAPRSGSVGSEVQARVAEYLARMADLQPARVDVVVDEVGPVRA